jgi:ankyrin repeat protein
MGGGVSKYSHENINDNLTEHAFINSFRKIAEGTEIIASSGRKIAMEEVLTIARISNVDIDIADERSGETALIMAVKKQNKDFIEALLDRGANITIADSSGKNAFDYAIDSKNVQMVADLIFDQKNRSEWLEKISEEGFSKKVLSECEKREADDVKLFSSPDGRVSPVSSDPYIAPSNQISSNQI